MDNELIDTYSIGGQTLVGFWGDYPRERGNCFSLYNNDKSKSFKVVNFNVENLEHLLATNVVRWPIKIQKLSDRHAIVKDDRIPSNYYSDNYCQVCTPLSLWPEKQLLARQAKIDSGELKIKVCDNGMIIETVTVKAAPRPLTGWTIESEEDEDDKEVLFYADYIPFFKLPDNID